MNSGKMPTKYLTNILLIILCSGVVSCDAITPEQQGKLDKQLQEAAMDGNLVKVQQALANEANIHADDDNALRMAVYWGRLKVVKFLIQHGANIHARDDQALQWAASCAQSPMPFGIHHPSIVAWLLYYGANREKLTEEQLEKLKTFIQEQAAKIQSAMHHGDTSRLEELLEGIPFDYLPEQTQIQIREFTQQRALYGATRVRKTKYS